MSTQMLLLTSYKSHETWMPLRNHTFQYIVANLLGRA